MNFIKNIHFMEGRLGEPASITASEAELKAATSNLSSLLDTPQAAQEGDIALIEVQGALQKQRDIISAILGHSDYGSIGKQLSAALDDDSVRGIVLRVDSPGGIAQGVDRLAEQVRQGAERKPIVAHVEGLCCSAAYYIAAGASKITAEIDAIVGSIGTIITHVSYAEALAKAGISVTRISDPDGKGQGGPFEPLSKEAEAELRAIVEDATSRFVASVSVGRDMPRSKVRELGGSIHTASAARGHGLLDGIGGLAEALQEAAGTPVGSS